MNNNSRMDTFDTIEIRRPDLARSYLGLLKAQPGRPIALFAPRRVGKTFFLDHDLTPLAKKSVLLPVYADVCNGNAIIAALRAVIHKRKSEVAAVFTGSSQSGLAKIMSTTGAPMYQFAQLLDFPALGDDYLQELSEHFARIHRGRKPKLDDLKVLFARIGFKPALMKDIVKSMSAEGLTDVEMALKHYIASQDASKVEK